MMALVHDISGNLIELDFSEKALRDVGDLPSPEYLEARAAEHPSSGSRTTQQKPERRFLSPGAFVRSTIGVPVVRLRTGIPTLDAITRGGLMVGKMTVIGGAPNAGKTTLAAQLGLHYARAGFFVGFLAKDEDREGILYRIGQAHGLALEDLENDTNNARADLANFLDDLPTLIVRDQDEEGVALELLVKELSMAANGRPAVLIVDSLQTIRSEAAAECDDKRSRVEVTTATLKAIGKRCGWLVIATCELARGAYRSQDAREHINDLAAFKESGDIEYAIAVGLVLRTVKGENNLVDVSVPKAKRGRPEPFRMRLDFQHASFTEVSLPTEEDHAAEEAAREAARHEQLVERVYRSIIRSPGIGGTDAIARAIGARRTAVGQALDDLRTSGRVINQGPKNRPSYRAAAIDGGAS